MKQKYLKFLYVGFFIFGVFFLVNSNLNITGAVIGLSNLSSTFSLGLGLVFVLIGIIIFTERGEGGLEKRAQNNNGGRFNKEDAKKTRDELLKEYRRKKIDETEFASRLNEQVGQLTGGLYNPGDKQLTVRFMGLPPGFIGYPLKIEGQGKNEDLALALHRRILANSPSYKPYCEFHYSKTASTKDHSKGLKELGL